MMTMIMIVVATTQLIIDSVLALWCSTQLGMAKRYSKHYSPKPETIALNPESRNQIDPSTHSFRLSGATVLPLMFGVQCLRKPSGSGFSVPPPRNWMAMFLDIQDHRRTVVLSSLLHDTRLKAC